MSEPIELRLAGHRLLVEPGLREWVEQTLAPRLREPESLPGAATIKANRVRTVARVDAPGGALFVKRFRLLKCGDRLAHLARASAARREWNALRRVAAAGIACPEPVVLAEERRNGLLTGSLLATRAVEGARDLTTEVDLRRAAGEPRDDLVAALARAVRALFQAGVDHPDLHLGNFLVRPGAAELVALDLHSARLGRSPLGAGARRSRLGKLAHSFGLFDPRTRLPAEQELLAFATAWAALDPALGPAGSLRDDLRARARRVEAARVKSRDKRCLVDSTTFAVERVDGKRVWRRRDAPLDEVLGLLDAPVEHLIHAHPKGRSRLEVVAAPPGLAAVAGPKLVRKRYPFPTLRSRVEGLLAPVPLRCWTAARSCEVRDVPHARAFALVLEGWPLPRRGTIFMELLAPVTMVHVLLEAPTPPAPRARRALARDLGTLLGRFHAAGLKHRDLAVQNLLIRPREDGWDGWVVDLDEVRAGAMSREERLRALTQLADLPPAATRTDRLRFFRAYLEAGGREVLAEDLAAWGARGIGRRVAARLAERAAAKARRLAKRPPRPAPTDLRLP